MIHDDAGLAAFLDGDVDEVEAAAWDEHLLDCDECWTALDQARRGRMLAESLREEVPPKLRDRVTEVLTTPARRRPRRRRLAVAVGAAAVAAASLGAGALVMGRGGGGIHDPQPIAAVLRLAAHRTEQPPAPDDRLRITRLNVNGRDVVLARSDDPFPMPDGAIALADDPHSPWLAQRGDVSLLCFSRPAPILLAGRASPQTLTEVAVAMGISMPGRNQTGVRGVPSG